MVWHPGWDGILSRMGPQEGWDPRWVGIPGGMASWGGLGIRVGWHPEWVDTLSGCYPKWVGSPSGMAARVGWHLPGRLAPWVG